MKKKNFALRLFSFQKENMICPRRGGGTTEKFSWLAALPSRSLSALLISSKNIILPLFFMIYLIKALFNRLRIESKEPLSAKLKKEKTSYFIWPNFILSPTGSPVSTWFLKYCSSLQLQWWLSTLSKYTEYPLKEK